MLKKIWFNKVADSILGLFGYMLCNHCGGHIVSTKEYLCGDCWDLMDEIAEAEAEAIEFEKSGYTWEDVFGY